MGPGSTSMTLNCTVRAMTLCLCLPWQEYCGLSVLFYR